MGLAKELLPLTEVWLGERLVQLSFGVFETLNKLKVAGRVPVNDL
jgi:hypothetical protein